jgi:hypothetical protein
MWGTGEIRVFAGVFPRALDANAFRIDGHFPEERHQLPAFVISYEADRQRLCA